MYEAFIQKIFLDLAEEIRSKVGESLTMQDREVTSVFATSKSNVIRKALHDKDGVVMCLKIRGLAGFLGKENEFHSRLGKELSAIAKTYGLGGIFHSDELPNHGITEDEVEKLRMDFQIGTEDAFVLVAGNRVIVAKVSDSLKKRLSNATIGVPAETRAASFEGETTFLRPRPGAARMYPETDIPLIVVSTETLDTLRKEIPEPWEKQVSDFSKKYDLPIQLAEPLFDSERRDLFEKVVRQTKLAPRYVASSLIDTMLSLSRDGVPVEKLEDAVLMRLFEALSMNKFAKEAMSRVLRQVSNDPTLGLDEVLSKVGLTMLGEAELDRVVDDVISLNMDLVRAKGTGAHSVLMGKIMQSIRGKADGKVVNDTLTTHLANVLEREKINQSSQESG